MGGKRGIIMTGSNFFLLATNYQRHEELSQIVLYVLGADPEGIIYPTPTPQQRTV
jgi:hypothetical protein